MNDIWNEDVCFLCGQPGTSADPLDRHHIFGGPFRRKSEHYGLVVKLHHSQCHLYGEAAVHRNREVMLFIKRYGQHTMERQGWTRDQFIREFGKNYLDWDEPLDWEESEG